MRLKRRKANNKPIPWTKDQENLLLRFLKQEVFDSNKLMELFPNRSMASIKGKVRKLRIKHDLYGKAYRDEKDVFTMRVANKVKPNTVFEAYAGAGNQTFNWAKVAREVYSCEKVKAKLIQFGKLCKANGFLKSSKKGPWQSYVKGAKSIFLFSGNNIDAAADLKVRKVKIDLIDLDTCGSTLPTVPSFLLFLRPKDIVITHGEFHSMRFNREDVLRRLFMHRDISQNPLPLSVDRMSDELDRAIKVSALRANNETEDSFWLSLKMELWLGGKAHGMLRRHYKVEKPVAAADCINKLSKRNINGTSHKR
jgi:hypothetical protein